MSYNESAPTVFSVTRIYWSSIFRPRDVFRHEPDRAMLDEVRYGFSVAMEELPEALHPFANPKQKQDGFYVRLESQYRIPILGPGNPGTYLWDLGCMGYSLDIMLQNTPMEICATGFEFDQSTRPRYAKPGSNLKIFPRAIRLKMEDVREAEKRYVASLGFGDG